MSSTNHSSTPEELDPVRLVGVGIGGNRLVAALHRGAEGPLADLLDSRTKLRHADRDLKQVDDYDLQGVAMLFIAIASDATEPEIRSALSLAWRALALDVRVISIVVRGKDNAFENVELAEALADEVIDGRIDVHANPTEEELQALRWFYGGLRSLARDGTLILEPGWDLEDVVDVLDLPGSRLTLATSAVPKGVSVLFAVSDALADLVSSGTDLALASGILIVLWRAPDQTLYVRDVREAARLAANAIGQGGLHLTLTARSKVSWGDVGGSATVVASTPGTYGQGAEP